MISVVPNLNADQLRAVEHPGGPLLVLAGPGTGKTGVLVARIAHLVADRGVRPERILALTFSRKAADEMSERVRSRVHDAALAETRTFHSLALSVVHPRRLSQGELVFGQTAFRVTRHTRLGSALTAQFAEAV